MDNIRLNTRFKSFNQPKVKAFTLAEVLITLVIIGVVAALTVPSIVINYQKKQYVIGLQKGYNFSTNAFRQMMAKDGVYKLSDTKFWSLLPNGNNITSVTMVSNNELKEEFSKIFGPYVIYTSENAPKDLKIAYGSLKCPPSSTSCFSALGTPEGMFFNDGIFLDFILRKEPQSAKCGSVACKSLKEFQEYKHTPTKFWQYMGDIQIDVNGPKKPNIWGRDMFKFALGNDGILYPYYGVEMASFSACNYSELNSCASYWKSSSATNTKNCSNDDGVYSYGMACAARIIEEGWQMKY